MITRQDIMDRFIEIGLPGSFKTKCSAKAHRAFLDQQAWLVLIHQSDGVLITVVRQRKDGVWENIK